MNKSSLFIFTLFTVIASGARAVQAESELVVLPTYVVEASRQQPVEQAINASLAELRQQARKPAVAAPATTNLQAEVASAAHGLDRGANRLAKS